MTTLSPITHPAATAAASELQGFKPASVTSIGREKGRFWRKALDGEYRPPELFRVEAEDGRIAHVTVPNSRNGEMNARWADANMVAYEWLAWMMAGPAFLWSAKFQAGVLEMRNGEVAGGIRRIASSTAALGAALALGVGGWTTTAGLIYIATPLAAAIKNAIDARICAKDTPIVSRDEAPAAW